MGQLDGQARALGELSRWGFGKASAASPFRSQLLLSVHQERAAARNYRWTQDGLRVRSMPGSIESHRTHHTTPSTLESQCTTTTESEAAVTIPQNPGKSHWSATGGAIVVRDNHGRSLLIRSIHAHSHHVHSLHVRPLHLCLLQIRPFHVSRSHIRSLHLCPLQIRLLHVCPLQIRSLHVCELHVRSLRQEMDLVKQRAMIFSPLSLMLVQTVQVVRVPLTVL